MLNGCIHIRFFIFSLSSSIFVFDKNANYPTLSVSVQNKVVVKPSKTHFDDYLIIKNGVNLILLPENDVDHLNF
jgi:hypothetical protein